MDYQEICKRIQMQIWHYNEEFNKMPNRIVLGKEIHDFLLAKLLGTIMCYRGTKLQTAFGIQIVTNHDNPHEISVGYVEEININ